MVPSQRKRTEKLVPEDSPFCLLESSSTSGKGAPCCEASPHSSSASLPASLSNVLRAPLLAAGNRRLRPVFQRPGRAGGTEGTEALDAAGRGERRRHTIHCSAARGRLSQPPCLSAGRLGSTDECSPLWQLYRVMVPPFNPCLGFNDPFQITSAQHFTFKRYFI